MTDRDLLGRQPLGADELGEADPREMRDALAAGRRLEASIDDVPVRVSADFSRRVMAAVATEPAPGDVGFMSPLRRRGLVAGFGESLRQAWAAIGAPGRPSFARATALAYVLVVAIAGVALAGAATVGVGSALGIFGPRPTDSAPPPSQAPGELLPTPGPQTAPAESDAAESDEPAESPDASDDHGGLSTGEPGDDHGGSSGPGSSDSGGNSGPGSSSSGSGSGSGSDDGAGSSSGSGSGSSSGSGSGETSSPRPSDTPRPTGTPKPSETPH